MSYKKYNQLNDKKFNEYEVMSVQNKDHRIQLLKENGIVCIDVWADWCAPCKEALPLYTELSKKYSGNALLIKEELNPTLAKEYELSQIPAFLIFVKGQLYRKVEGFKVEEIENTILELLGMFQTQPAEPVKATMSMPYNSSRNEGYKKNYGQ